MNGRIGLLRQLDDALINTCKEAKQIGYNPTRFIGMLNEYREQYGENGSFQLANDLIQRADIPYGFDRLVELGRLDLSVEAIVLNGPWKQLFNDDVLEQARNKLTIFGYSNPPEFEEDATE